MNDLKYPNQNHLYINDTVNNFNNSINSNNLTLLYSPFLTLLIAIAAGVMSLVTIFGNVLVITAFIIDKNLRIYANFFILNLSIADLLIGLLIPMYTPFLLFNRTWIFGRVACTIWLVLDYVVGSASVLCIVVISLDRYFLVSRELKYVADQKISRAICMMITVWVIAFINYAPAIVFWELISGVKSNNDQECQVGFHDNLVYLTATACVEFFAPLFSICALNLAVYLNIRKRSRGLIRSENPQFILANKDLELDKKPENHVKLLNNKRKLSDKVINLKSIHKSTSSTCSSSSLDESMKQTLNTNGVKNDPSFKANYNDINLNEIEKSMNLTPPKSFQLNTPLNESNTTQFLNNTFTTISSNNSINNNNNNSNNNFRSIKNNNPGTNNKNKKSKNKNYSKKNLSTRSNLSKDKKAARSLFILVFVFVCCWAPYTFLTLIKSVCARCIGDELYEFTFWLLWFNSTFNPILYPFLHVKFRKAFLKIFRYLFFCFKSKQPMYRNTMARKTIFTTVQDKTIAKNIDF